MLFSIYNCKDTNSKNAIHNGSSVTILECTNREENIYMVGRHDVDGIFVSWFAHVGELTNFDGA